MRSPEWAHAIDVRSYIITLESALTTRWLRPLFVSLTLLIGAQPVAGHNLTFTETLLLLRTDGTFQVDLTCDLDALALGVSQDTDDAELVRALRSFPPDVGLIRFGGRVSYAG